MHDGLLKIYSLFVTQRYNCHFWSVYRNIL